MNQIFGLNTQRSSAHLILLPLPWEVTTSYGSGTSQGPKAILNASSQLDLWDIELGPIFKAGIFLENESPELRRENEKLKALAQKHIANWEEYGENTHTETLTTVNEGTQKMVDWVRLEASNILDDEDKMVGLVGGDHSTPLGLIHALSERHEDYGILHIDAHADLRNSYQGFKHSHASIMKNVLDLPRPPKKLVQVGIRDFCEEEYELIHSRPLQIHCHFDRELKRQLFCGDSWDRVCQRIVQDLPEKVYISFDIDGLSPEFCPNTGTPVPGGLSFDQAIHLLGVLGRSQREIIGFDLNEVAPGKNSEWDGNVGARLLYKLCGWTLKCGSL